MKHALRILSAFAVLLVVSAAWGANTGKISGKVTDAKTREPLVGVNILVTGTRMGGVTDVQGDYFVANVPPGIYTLKASQVGYKDLLIKDLRVRVDATTELKIVMEQTVLDIGEEVVITAQRPPVQKDNTAARVYVESSEIQNMPAATIGDVAITLPSVDVNNGQITVRGGGLTEVSFLIDGARARNPNSQTPYTNLNLSSVQELEVITGPYSAEFGEARSGVFNVITKEGSEKYRLYFEGRYGPPGVKHWGPSLYDENYTGYWENTHARHLQWWIDYPDEWVDPSGRFGKDPLCAWTPEQAYENYMATHQPLTNYTKQPSYSGELSLGGPFPGVDNFTFFVSGRYRVEPPLMGNSYRDKGQFFDGTAKLAYQLDPKTKLTLSGFLGTEETSWGIGGGPDYFWAGNYGIDSRYAYYDWAGLPTTQTDGQTLKMTRVIDQSTMFEVKIARVYARRQVDVFPNDPLGWEANGATTDYLRAGIKGADGNRIGYNTTGYYDRYNDKNTDLTGTAYYSNQVTKNVLVKTGGEFTYYILEHFNQAKPPDRRDSSTYNPYQGAVYAQAKLEFSGFIMNAGVRYDFYNPNDLVYLDLFNPLTGPTEKTKPFTQFSPRLGISHPIDEYTVLHFSYGHFFQRTNFFDYGEGNSPGDQRGNLTTFIVDGTTDPWVLGNRNVRPEKTVSYELGIERNFFQVFVLGVTAYYKDIRNTLRTISVQSPTLRYTTNGNADYADVRGFEISLRKQASRESWGTTWGYANFTTQVGIYGQSGDPYAITPSGGTPPSKVGDQIDHNDPRLKLGVYYETPSSLNFLGGALERLSISVDYQMVFANDLKPDDFFQFEGQKYIRPPDQNTNLKIRKDILFGNDLLRLGIYVEVRNVFNNKWLDFSTQSIFYTASPEDQRTFVESGFTSLPSVDNTGTPILELSMYRNLPRSVFFGVTMEL
jgi:outer membrane receptor protein involved in Fe transport